MWRLLTTLALASTLALPAGADPRFHSGGSGGGWGGGSHWAGQGHWGGRYGHPGGSWGRYGDDAGAGFLGGLFGGIIGGWLTRPEPPVVIVPEEPIRDIDWCLRRYRSYDSYTRTYLGFDGLRHGCP